MITISLYGENFIVDGSKAWEQYDNGEKNYNSTYFGYYLGVINGIRVSVDDVLFCIPNEVDNNQLCAIARKYIKNNPEKWNEGAWSLIFTPLKKAFPCKKKK
jgi:hypothetical protein